MNNMQLCNTFSTDVKEHFMLIFSVKGTFKKE